MARALGACRLYQRPHRIQLVVAREHQLLGGDQLLAAAPVVHFLLVFFDEQKVPQDVQKAALLQRFLPKVAGAVTAGVLRVARAALNLPWVAAPVEGQKKRLLFGQPRGHPHFVGVGGKVDQCAFLEIEQRRTRVAVALVLAHRMAPGLVRAGVLQLDGGHRQAVDCQHHVGGGVVARVARHLPRHGELVACIQRQNIGRQRVRRSEIRQPKQLAVKLKTVAQHMQAALDVQLFDQRIQQHRLQECPVLHHHLGPQPGLGGFDKGEHPGREQGAGFVPLGVGAGLPAAFGEHVRQIALKRFFGGLCHRNPSCVK